MLRSATAWGGPAALDGGRLFGFLWALWLGLVTPTVAFSVAYVSRNVVATVGGLLLGMGAAPNAFRSGLLLASAAAGGVAAGLLRWTSAGTFARFLLAVAAAARRRSEAVELPQ